LILLSIATLEVSALSFGSFLAGLQHISRFFSKKANHETHRLILTRAVTASNCTSPCSWIINTESCPSGNLECDCGFVINAGVTGVAACADCFNLFNATAANEAVQVGLYCGVNAVSQVTFSYNLSTPTTTIRATTSLSGATHSLITTSDFTTVETSTSSASTSQTSSSSQFPSPTAEPAANTGTASSAGSGGLSGGAIGGIVGGIVGGFLLLGALLFLLLRSKLSGYSQWTPMTHTDLPYPKKDAPALETNGGEVPSGRLRYPDGEQMQEAASGRLSRTY